VRTWPHDKEAERACIGNSLQSPDWHYRARLVVEPGDFYFTEHQVLFSALDDLYDIGPFVPTFSIDFELFVDMWPITLPSSLGVRIGAVFCMGPVGAPLWALRRLADCATGAVESSAALVRARSEQRAEILALEQRIDELARSGP
jgi:hypothetical protein